MSKEQLTHTDDANQEEIPLYPFPFADHSLQLPEEYDRLRQQCPVARVHMPYGGDAFVPTRYEEIAQAFANPKCAAIQASDGAVPRLEAGNVTGTEEGSEIGEIFAVSDARYNKLCRVIAPALQARNKKSITLDLRTLEGQEIVLKLLPHVDVVLENFRPGTLEKWNLGFEAMKAVNPDVIFVRNSGYGQTGPYRDRPGFGGIAEAMGGCAT